MRARQPVRLAPPNWILARALRLTSGAQNKGVCVAGGGEGWQPNELENNQIETGRRRRHTGRQRGQADDLNFEPR